MKSTITIFLSMSLILLLAFNSAEAQRRGQARQGNRAAVGEQQVNGGNRQMQNGRNNEMVGGMGNGVQLAQAMITQFDQDGDAALNATELQLAMNMFMQRLQVQMQQQQRLGRGMQQKMAQEQGQMTGRNVQGERRGGPGRGHSGGRGR